MTNKIQRMYQEMTPKSIVSKTRQGLKKVGICLWEVSPKNIATSVGDVFTGSYSKIKTQLNFSKTKEEKLLNIKKILKQSGMSEEEFLDIVNQINNKIEIKLNSDVEEDSIIVDVNTGEIIEKQ